eukprot:Platyproteum_vivax@DN4575_c0_g1_i2.p1
MPERNPGDSLKGLFGPQTTGGPRGHRGVPIGVLTTNISLPFKGGSVGNKGGLLDNLLEELRKNAGGANSTGVSEEKPDEGTKQLSIRKARPLLEDSFTAKMVSEEDAIVAAHEAAEQTGIIFIDELDKLVDDESTRGEMKSKKRGVQKELLSLMEGTSVTTRIGRINTEHILFIAAGAFTSSKPADIMPELQARVSVTLRYQPPIILTPKSRPFPCCSGRVGCPSDVS